MLAFPPSNFSKRSRAFVYYVYILRSISHPTQIYVGYAHNLKNRLAEHNTGESAHTSKFAPWTLAGYVALPERPLALRLEKYLKSGSGHSFAKRHLLGRKTVGRGLRNVRAIGKEGREGAGWPRFSNSLLERFL